MKLVIIVISLTLINAIAQIFFKKGSVSINFSSAVMFVLSIVLNANVVFALFLYAMSSVLLILALRIGDLSFVYPMLGATYVWVSLISFFYFNEMINIQTIFGDVLIILGISVLGLNGHKKITRGLQ